jgi:hypothetical protein
MKRYYNNKNGNGNKKSKLIYLLSVPFVMYLYKYFYLNPNDDNSITNSIMRRGVNKNEFLSIKNDTNTVITSEALLTELYPETSVNISSTRTS